MIKILRCSFIIVTHLLVISVLPGMLIVNHPLHPPLSPTSSYIVIVNILIQSNGFSSPDYCCAGCCPPPGHSSPSSFSLRGSTVSRKLHRTQGKDKLLFLWVSILVLSAAKWVWKSKVLLSLQYILWLSLQYMLWLSLQYIQARREELGERQLELLLMRALDPQHQVQPNTRWIVCSYFYVHSHLPLAACTPQSKPPLLKLFSSFVKSFFFNSKYGSHAGCVKSKTQNWNQN